VRAVAEALRGAYPVDPADEASHEAQGVGIVQFRCVPALAGKDREALPVQARQGAVAGDLHGRYGGDLALGQLGHEAVFLEDGGV